MKLFQYEQFFEKHPDLEVKRNGRFLLGVIDQLQTSLSITQEWANMPPVSGLTRFEQMKLQIMAYACERNGGRKDDAALWLGLCRQTMYAAMKYLNSKKATNVIQLNNRKHEENNLVFAHHSVDCLPVIKAVSRRRSSTSG